MFRAAIGATAVVPVLAGCHKEPAPGVAYIAYPVAQQGYENPPPADPCPGGQMVASGSGPDAGKVCLQVGVAAVGYQNPPPAAAVADAAADGRK